MPTNMELYVPSSPSKFSFRPLNKGMITSDTTMSMPDGSFLEVNGFDVTPRGPKKHGGWQPALYESGSTTPLQFVPMDASERIESQLSFPLADGSFINLLVTNRAVYIVSPENGYVRLNWMQPYTIATTTTGASTTTFTVTGDFRRHYITTTDKVVNAGIDYPIQSVTATASTLTVVFTGVVTLTPGNGINIFKPFASDALQYTDFTISRNKCYFVDGTTQMIWRFDGVLNGTDSLYYLVAHEIFGADGTTRTVMGACSVTAFGERLYFAGTTEYDSVSTVYFGYNRIRWTEVLNHNQSLAANYQDLIRTNGKLVKIVGMGSLIMAYMDDGIYYGRATSLTSIPYAFTYIESAGVTALGMKAVTTYFDGQVFQGYDNVYFISSDVQITPLGDAIVEELRSRSQAGQMSNISIDTVRSRITLATSNTPDVLECVFFYNYRAKAWSINDSLNFIAPVYQFSGDYLTYDEVDESYLFVGSPISEMTYREFSTGQFSKNFYVYMNGYLMKYVEESGLNSLVTGGVVIPSQNPCELITPDFDFDDPDTDKTSLRLSMKISDDPDTIRTENIYFMVDGSRDRGYTWKHLGRMRILPTRDEDALNFRLSGSTLRFRMRQGYDSDGTSTNVNPFTISEVVLRLRERSIEAQRSNAREA
jgi:hypothetical protein